MAENKRYSDPELQEFKTLILNKLERARVEYSFYNDQLKNENNSAEDTNSNYMTVEDGALSQERERLSQIAGRQMKFIDHLENALIRVENKTYGVCRSTGNLISKERLMAVPHATLCIEAKNAQNK